MIWPILLPTLLFCQDDTMYSATQSGQGLELNIEGTKSGSAADSSSGGSWNTSDHDSFLQDPAPPESVSVEGTITEECGDDLYDSE